MIYNHLNFERTDQFIEIETIEKRKDNLMVLLTGKRRQYIINKLEEKNKFYLFRNGQIQNLNELYNCRFIHCCI